MAGGCGFVVAAADYPGWQLHGAARPPSLPHHSHQHRPGAHEVMEPSANVERLHTGLRADIEVVGLAQPLPQPMGALACAVDGFLVRSRQASQYRMREILRHDRDRNRPLESVVEIAQKPVAHAERAVG